MTELDNWAGAWPEAEGCLDGIALASRTHDVGRIVEIGMHAISRQHISNDSSVQRAMDLVWQAAIERIEIIEQHPDIIFSAGQQG